MLNTDLATLKTIIVSALNYRNGSDENEQRIFSQLLVLLNSNSNNYENYFLVSELKLIIARLKYLIPLRGFSNDEEYYLYSDFITKLEQSAEG